MNTILTLCLIPFIFFEYYKIMFSNQYILNCKKIKVFDYNYKNLSNTLRILALTRLLQLSIIIWLVIIDLNWFLIALYLLQIVPQNRIIVKIFSFITIAIIIFLNIKTILWIKLIMQLPN